MVLLWGYEKNRNTTLVFENNSNEKQKPPFYKTKTPPFPHTKKGGWRKQKGGLRNAKIWLL